MILSVLSYEFRCLDAHGRTDVPEPQFIPHPLSTPRPRSPSPIRTYAFAYERPHMPARGAIALLPEFHIYECRHSDVCVPKTTRLDLTALCAFLPQLSWKCGRISRPWLLSQYCRDRDPNIGKAVPVEVYQQVSIVCPREAQFLPSTLVSSRTRHYKFSLPVESIFTLVGYSKALVKRM